MGRQLRHRDGTSYRAWTNKLRKVADVLGNVGCQDEVDAFVLSMNRAAGKAAPRAKACFAEAIREMTFEDDRKILEEEDTAATEYFRGKTQKKLYDDFRPVVSASPRRSTGCSA